MINYIKISAKSLKKSTFTAFYSDLHRISFKEPINLIHMVVNPQVSYVKGEST